MKLINNIYHAEAGCVLMINLAGSLKEVRPENEALLRTQGWVGVANPRRNYFPEYDRSAGGTKPSDNIIENLETTDILPGGFV